MNANTTKHPADCVLCPTAKPGSQHHYIGADDIKRHREFVARIAVVQASLKK